MVGLRDEQRLTVEHLPFRHGGLRQNNLINSAHIAHRQNPAHLHLRAGFHPPIDRIRLVRPDLAVPVRQGEDLVALQGDDAYAIRHDSPRFDEERRGIRARGCFLRAVVVVVDRQGHGLIAVESDPDISSGFFTYAVLQCGHSLIAVESRSIFTGN